MKIRIPNPNTKSKIVDGLISDGRSIRADRIAVRVTKDMHGRSISFSDEKDMLIMVAAESIKDLITYLISD